ncbi:Hypothetical protein PROPJV5_1493 [Propionibacterium ruminifibrarum]|uniref:Uncharacterized protein n=1 Tax=Propionibacterium ruminifibrarum TaxID=1962131 RepID=A0A375I115_9ACTN|nr:hypothetical protein [Propionibacterium ruminifibrarum]SPF68513.1 Hypothetical protein PROPJV5_1493 [Propionibacterium ruminifibrarum]
MNVKLRSVSEAADLMDSDPVREFLVGFDNGHEKDLRKGNSNRTGLEKIAAHEGLERWKKGHPRVVAWLTLVSAVVTLFLVGGFACEVFVNSRSSVPVIVAWELLMILITCTSFLLVYHGFHGRQVLAERAMRCVASLARFVGTFLQIPLMLFSLSMLVLLIIAVYQAYPGRDLLRHINSLLIALLLTYFGLGSAAFLYYSRTQLDFGLRRPHVMRLRLLIAVFGNCLWALFVISFTLFGVLAVRKLKSSDHSLKLSLGGLVFDVFDVFVGVVVSGVLAAVIPVWKTHGRVMGDAVVVIERVLILIRKVKTGDDWRMLGVGDLEAIYLVLDLERVLGENLCPQWCPLRFSIESFNYRTILCREVMLILGVRYRTVVPQFESKNWLLERYGIELGGSIAGVDELVRELELLRDQLKVRTWRPFVNS